MRLQPVGDRRLVRRLDAALDDLALAVADRVLERLAVASAIRRSLRVEVAAHAGLGQARARGAAVVAAREPVEVLDVVALVQAGLVRDLPGLDQVGQVLVHGVHALLGAGLHGRVDLVRLALADQVADGGRRDQHLGRDGTARRVGALGERLADDALERARRAACGPAPAGAPGRRRSRGRWSARRPSVCSVAKTR